ncbi:hypothetical protein E2P81_ATG07944 [Venturia nashicola]|uniref:Uncharacterized protein n=1 Tax=Venturia nashicola TaxID=86259 RepID=A0A4Z1P0Y7_9PEZI|nr:hypothetical protein E6O75_ATG08116 [Venturia nashicola]TLD26132.1 hypothetical protein E2P81_ATG07944 [Venturia nashicola]
MSQPDNWISKKVQSWVSSIGNTAGGAITGVGNGVSGAGRGMGNSVTNASRGWADGVRSYGNAIKDSTGASGPRAITSSNPLGIAGTKGVWAPSSNTKGPRNSGRGTAKDPLGLGK